MIRFAVVCALAVFTANAAPPDGAISYLLLDATNGNVNALNWPAAGIPVPVGSLVKPFIAITYGQRHRMRFPVHQCTGNDCWLKTGHGSVGLAQAIACSCNSYFRELAEDIPPAGVDEVVERFGLRGPPQDCASDTLFGMGRDWPLAPIQVARAYAELAARRAEPGIAEVVEGMRLAARVGTAAAVGSALRGTSALAKTGTAPCSHSLKAEADGYAIVVYPADIPRYVLLIQVHGVVGRQAAQAAARLLRSMGVR